MNEFIQQLIFEHLACARSCPRPSYILFSRSLFPGWEDRQRKQSMSEIVSESEEYDLNRNAATGKFNRA